MTHSRPTIDFPRGVLLRRTRERPGRPAHRFRDQSNVSPLAHKRQRYSENEMPSLMMDDSTSQSEVDKPSSPIRKFPKLQQTPSLSTFRSPETLQTPLQTPARTPSYSESAIDQHESLLFSRLIFESQETRGALTSLSLEQGTQDSVNTINFPGYSGGVHRAEITEGFLQRHSWIRNEEEYRNLEIDIGDIPRFFDSQVSASLESV